MAGISPDFDHANPAPSTQHRYRLKLACESPYLDDFAPPLKQLARALARNMRFVRREVDDSRFVIGA
jgi:hypothetical protein